MILVSFNKQRCLISLRCLAPFPLIISCKIALSLSLLKFSSERTARSCSLQQYYKVHFKVERKCSGIWKTAGQPDFNNILIAEMTLRATIYPFPKIVIRLQTIKQLNKFTYSTAILCPTLFCKEAY